MRNLDEFPALGFLQEMGIPTVDYGLAGSEDEVVEVAARIGFPVAIKVSAEKILHKTELGGVALDIGGPDEARAAYRRLLDAAATSGVAYGSGLRGVIVQEMVRGGTEFILGGFRDPGFGPVIMFGLGGIFTELFKDASFRLAPVDEEEAGRMISETRAGTLITGFRGAPALDRGAICAVISRLSERMAASDEILEFDINPFVAFPSRVLALDALFKLN
ncbi:MAG: acetyl-CoA synthetase [Spirochaetae bacterium HGW-Spirochaetae-7]|nr:MAG: acetyl-CoA synthetase [Spirochaetae bacterium HGW-Spirochaetae-7]